MVINTKKLYFFKKIYYAHINILIIFLVYIKIINLKGEEMKTLFSSSDTLLVVIFAIVAIGLWVQKFKIFKSLGPALTVIIIGIILSNLKVVPTGHEVYGVLSTVYHFQ